MGYFKPPTTIVPSGVLPVISEDTKRVGGLRGESSNHFDDLFKNLEAWEAILSSLPDLGVAQNPAEEDWRSPVIDPF